MITKKGKGLIYYERNAFTNATEEEWLAFMKERNPKIKMKCFKKKQKPKTKIRKFKRNCSWCD